MHHQLRKRKDKYISLILHQYESALVLHMLAIFLPLEKVLQKYHEHPSPFKNVQITCTILIFMLADLTNANDMKRIQSLFIKRLSCVITKIKVQFWKSFASQVCKLTAFSVRNKYSKMFKRKFGRCGTFTDFVMKLSTKMRTRNKAANHLKAQQLVQSGLQQLSLYKHKFIRS